MALQRGSGIVIYFPLFPMLMLTAAHVLFQFDI